MRKFDLGNGHTIVVEKAERGIENDYKVTFFEDGRKLDEGFYSKEALEFQYDVSLDKERKELTVEEDGVAGYIVDVTNETFYKDADITLYDELEHAAHGLACEYAELIGVHLDKNELGDFEIAKEVSEAIMGILEKRFNIPFPVSE